MKRLIAAAATAILLSAAQAPAATFPEETPFTQSAFDAAKKAGDPILVHITASWCTTCAAQKPVVDKLRAEPAFRNYKVFNIDFDSQKPLVRQFGAREQSTLIVFKGALQEGRSVGATEAPAIKNLMQKGL